MQFLNAAALIALLPALGSATCFRCKSLLDTSMATGNGNAGNAPGANDCGVSSFTKITQSNRPDVEDCKQLVANLWKDQQWVVTPTGVQVAVFQTCSFNAVSFDGNTLIGNADVKDLINDSITKFKDSGYSSVQGSYKMYVAASGTTGCSVAQNSDKQVRVDWTISHP